MHSSYPRQSRLRLLRAIALGLCASIVLAACGLDGAGDTINSSSGSGNGTIGSGSSGGVASGTYSIGGTIVGLSGTGLALADNGGNALTITGNGGFTFTNGVAPGGAYSVTVQSQPIDPTQVCSVANGAGTVSTVNIVSVTVSCTTNFYTVSGTVSGLTGSGLVVQTNGSNNVAVASNGTYTLATLASGSNYTVTVMTQPGGPSQTCTVANDAGMVTGSNVTNVAITCITNSYTVGGSVSGLTGSGLVLQTNGADNLPVSAPGSYVFATLPSGAAYTVTVLTQPTSPLQHCTVANGTGTMAMINVTNVTVTCRNEGRFAFVADATLDTLSAFTINPISGLLTPVNSLPTGNTPNAVAVTPDGQFVYTANQDAPSVATPGANPGISIFSVNPASGALIVAGTQATAAGTFPQAITIDPSGQFALVADGANATVLVFSINPANGALTPVGSPVAAASNVGGNPSSIAVDPSDQFVYVTDQYEAQVFSFAFNAATGALTPLASSPTASGNTPVWVSIDPTGQFLYVSNQGDSTASGWTINGAGALTATAGSPYAAEFATGGNPEVVAIDPTDQFLYVTDVVKSTVVAFNIAPTTGVLSPMAGSPFTVGGGPWGEAIDPSGQFLYTTNSYDGTISMFTINGTTGALTAVPGSPLAAPSAPSAIAIE
jgi:6-phosphogluconolactonase (cycloisomerase 2 family)